MFLYCNIGKVRIHLKISHARWRKEHKKLRRKYIRIRKAQERDRLLEEEAKKRQSSPTYKAWMDEQEALEVFREQEEELLYIERYKNWVEQEAIAQHIWKENQKKLELIRAEKAKQDLLIREEWEREQKKLLDKKEREEKLKEEEEKRQALIFEQIENYVAGLSNELPSSSRCNHETRPGEPLCPFFAKVGACRFRDNCSRNHIRPGVSRILLIPRFFTHFGLDRHVGNEYDTDISLEYEDSDKYDAFLTFYEDVVEELKSYGEIVLFKVCCNGESHLKGNVYIQYACERNAIRAYRALHGRYYGGKRIYPEFCDIPAWNKAICGLFWKKRCPKGNECNFLHVFRNPRNEYSFMDIDTSVHRIRTRRKESSWTWSPSPERISLSDSIRSNRERSSSNNRRYRETNKKRDDKERRDGNKKRKSRQLDKANNRYGDKSSRGRRRSQHREQIDFDEVHRHSSRTTRPGRRKVSSSSSDERRPDISHERSVDVTKKSKSHRKRKEKRRKLSFSSVSPEKPAKEKIIKKVEITG